METAINSPKVSFEDFYEVPDLKFDIVRLRADLEKILEEKKFNYSYEDEGNYYFIDPKSFEQIDIKKNFIGEKSKMLSENLEVSVSFHNESPISIQLPNQISCKIDKTDIALKGQTVSSSYKPATLDNGLNIQVPPFIESGDDVIIDTRSFEYIKKI